MALPLGRLVGVPLRAGEIVAVEDVDPFEDGAREVVVRVLHAGVEERDRHSPARGTGKAEPGPDTRARSELAPLEQLARGRRGVGDPNRVDALDLRKALEQRNRAGVQRCREAREHAREAELRTELEAGDAEPSEELALRRLGGVCQRRWLDSLARPPAAATRRASDGVRRTTIIAAPTGTSGRGPPTRPRHETGSSPALSEEPPVAAAT